LEAIHVACRILPIVQRPPQDLSDGCAAGTSEHHEGSSVKRTANHERAQSWVVDYSAARARAIKWLGDRYLLARPINASHRAWRKAP
jgi:hypothetical protein